MIIDEILVDVETAWIKKGKVYLFSDSYLALKHYDKHLSHVENNEKNKKYGYVYKGELYSKTKRGSWPFCCKTENGTIEYTTFICRV